MQVARFTLIGDCLYRRSFGGPYLKCLNSTKTQYVLAELHEGMCDNHTRGRSLVHCAHSQGYYWPTMKQDEEAYVEKCDRCQCTHSTHAIRSSQPNNEPLAIRAVGDGLSRAPTHRGHSKEIPACGHRLL